MQSHRFIGDFDLSQNRIIVNNDNFINQVKNVLRLRVGDEMILCDGKMDEARAKISLITKDKSELSVLETRKNENEPENYAHLYCPILKKENFEWAVQKAVEVGVKEITPIITARTVKLGLNYERLNKIIKEAAEQSGRGILPKLNETADFDRVAVEAKSKNELNLFFDIGASPLGHPMSKFKNIGVFVGPEGGWMEEEIEKARMHNFVTTELGKTVLRAETAAIVASYLAVSLQ